MNWCSIFRSTPSKPRAPMYRILCVEDDHDVAALIQRKLQRLGHRVVLAPNVDTALRQISEEPPNLVLLDFGLGGTNDGGWRVFRELRDTPATSRIPVFAV